MHLHRRLVLQGMVGTAGAVIAAPALSQDAAEAPFGIPGSYGDVLPSFKHCAFVKKAAGVSDEAFARQWVEVQGPRLAKLPGLTGLVLNVVQRDRSPTAPFDGFAELYYGSEAARDAKAEAEVEALGHAVAQPHMRLFSREIILRAFEGPYPAGSVKRIGLVTRKPHLERAAFLKDWRDVHGPEANRQRDMIRYTLNIKIPRLNPDITFDGFAELWWKDWAAYEAAAAQRLREREDEVRRGIELPSLPATLVFVAPHDLMAG